MDSFTINAVVLREVQYKDNDTIITLLSAEKGLITATAKGILKMLSKNRPAVQLFCYSEFELAKYGNQYIIKSAVLKEQFYALRNDVNRYALACYITQAASTFCTEDNDETDAFRLVLNTLHALADTKSEKPLWQIKAAFELKLCAVCGFMPQINICSSCGTDLTQKSQKAYYFSLSEGSIFCTECTETHGLYGNKDLYIIKVSHACLCAMKYVCDSPIQRFLSFKVSKDISQNLADVCERYLLFLAERNFDTLKYYKSITNSTFI